MRIVNRIEFLKLPPGTLFCQCDGPWAFDDLHIKYDSLIWDADGDGDFVSMPFTIIENGDSEQYFARLDEMHQLGASYPLDLEFAGRDGCFVKEALFLVYEQADVEKLRDFFTDLAGRSAVKASAE